MTVVAAKVIDNEIVIASDSYMGDYRSDRKSVTGTNIKLFRSGDVIVGMSGPIIDPTLLNIFCKTHVLGENADQIRVMEWMLEYVEWKKSKVNDFEFSSCALIGHKSGLYCCEGMSCFKVNEFAAIGAGSDIAIAALYLGKSPEEAANVAIELCSHCSGPVNIMKTEKR